MSDPLYNYNHPPQAFAYNYSVNNDRSQTNPYAHPLFDTNIAHSQSRPQSGRNTPYVDSYFDDAFRASPSPPPPNFFANILNPAPSSLPFGYHSQPSPRLQPKYSPPASSNLTPPLMAPSSRTARLPNGYVDLTSETEATPAPQRRSKRSSPTPGPSSKRLKRDDGATARTSGDMGLPEVVKMEEIDLSQDNADIQDVLQKQRADAVKAHQKPEEKPTTFSTFSCVICMDAPTDITATSCGHLFCHTCLMEALIAGENRSGPGEPKRSQCPVCRKHISRTKAADIIPLLLLKKGLASQPRKSSKTSTPKDITRKNGKASSSGTTGRTRATRGSGARRSSGTARSAAQIRDAVTGLELGARRSSDSSTGAAQVRDAVTGLELGARRTSSRRMP